MLTYRPSLKPLARTLRSNMTDAEQKLWFHLRRKQLLNVPFYRQRPIGKYIVDFYAPSAKLVIEVDGAQHADPEKQQTDLERTAFLNKQDLVVLRCHNHQVLSELESVLTTIHNHIEHDTKEK